MAGVVSVDGPISEPGIPAAFRPANFRPSHSLSSHPRPFAFLGCVNTFLSVTMAGVCDPPFQWCFAPRKTPWLIAHNRSPTLSTSTSPHPRSDRMVAIVAFKSNRCPSFVFRSLFRKNAVYLTAIFAGAFAFELCVTSMNPPNHT